MTSDTRHRPKVLYIAYWGAAEPLGQSLILPAIKKLADLGAELTLLTFEKPRDLRRLDEVGSIRSGLEKQGVRWIALGYHKRPRVPATAFDCIQGCARGIAAGFRIRPDVVHARTFVGGLIGYAVARLTGARFVYHNEGFYPDEQVDGGVWKENSTAHRFARFLERQMYARADGIVVLSRRAKTAVESLPAVRRNATPVVVVPSCVDLDHFRYGDSRPADETRSLRFVYVGSVGGRYTLDKAARFVAVASRESNTHLQILSGSQPDLVDSMMKTSGLGDEAWSLAGVPYSSMPEELANRHAGLFFLTRGISEQACSPTKIGEYWAMGLPVVATPNAGDTDEITREERVGVILDGHSEECYARAFSELKALLDDPELRARCRRAAETHYALGPACERQLELYRSLIAPRLTRSARRAAGRDRKERRRARAGVVAERGGNLGEGMWE